MEAAELTTVVVVVVTACPLGNSERVLSVLLDMVPDDIVLSDGNALILQVSILGNRIEHGITHT